MLTLREAAYRVLAEAKGPLSVEEITQRAKERGLLSSTSKTPAASMGAALYVDVKRNPNSPFVQVGPAKFALKPEVLTRDAESPPVARAAVRRQDIAEQIEEHNRRVKAKLLAALKEMDPKTFEHLIARLLERIGYEGVQVTRYSGDGGIDIRATLTVGGVTSVPTAIQVKRYAGNVPGKVIRELRGSLGVHERGLVITTSDFTKDAQAEASASDKVPISLVNGKRLVDLLVEKQLGVVARQVHVLDLDLDSLEPTEDGTDDPRREKYRSIFPLPGGDYLAALNSMLEFIAAESPTEEDMVDWIKTQFPLVSSTTVAKRYISLLRAAGLILYDGSQLVVSDDGAAYLSDPTPAYLLDVFRRRFLGLDELLEILAASPGPLEHVHRELVDRLKVEWTTPAQTKYRLEWLQALGAAAKGTNGVWFAVSPADRSAKAPPGTDPAAR